MINTIDARGLLEAFLSGANRLCNHKNILNDLNVFPVPDGDTGSNMSMTVSAASRELLSREYTTAGEVMAAVASASSKTDGEKNSKEKEGNTKLTSTMVG